MLLNVLRQSLESSFFSLQSKSASHAQSRSHKRNQAKKEFGATDIVAERGEEGIARVQELTNASALILRASAWARRNPCCRRFGPLVLAGT